MLKSTFLMGPGRLPGNRAWCAQSTHGSSDTNMVPSKSVLPRWGAAFGNQAKSLYTIKRFQTWDSWSEHRADALAAEIQNARAAGMRIHYQTVDKDIRPAQQTRELTNAVTDSLRRRNAPYDYLSIGNELDIRDNLESKDIGEYLVSRLQGIDLVPGARLILDSLSGYGNAQRWASRSWTHVQNSGYDMGRVASVIGVHQYNLPPSLSLELGAKENLMRATGADTVANLETDQDFTGGDRWTDVGAAYQVTNALAHARKDMVCASFVLQNGPSGGAFGNGLFQEDGTPHPSGQAQLDWVGPFLHVPMKPVIRLEPTLNFATDAFVNEAGQLIVSFSGAVNNMVSIAATAFNTIAAGRDVAYAQAQIQDFLEGGAKPQRGPFVQQDWDRLRLTVQAASDNLTEDYATIKVLGIAAATWQLRAFLGAAPTVRAVPGGIEITLAKWAAARIQL